MKKWQWVMVIGVVSLVSAWYCGAFDFLWGDIDSGLYLAYALIGLVFLMLFIYHIRGSIVNPGKAIIKYDFGFPGIEKSKQGILKLENDRLMFKDWLDSKKSFFIPVKDIVNAGREANLLGISAAVINTPGQLLVDKQYFIVRFRQEGKENTVCFSSDASSPVFVALEEKIRSLRKKTGFPLPEQKKQEKPRKFENKDRIKVIIFLVLFFAAAMLIAFTRFSLLSLFASYPDLIDYSVYAVLVLVFIAGIVVSIRKGQE